MQNLRKWFPVIFSACIFVLFSIVILVIDIGKHHDSSNLLLHFSLLLNVSILVGALIWFGERWKYFRITGLVLFLIGCVILTIHHWQERDPWGYIFWPIWGLWGLYSLKEEIVKYMTHHVSPETSNEHFSGS
jgi:hypothetical protein